MSKEDIKNRIAFLEDNILFLEKESVKALDSFEQKYLEDEIRSAEEELSNLWTMLETIND